MGTWFLNRTGQTYTLITRTPNGAPDAYGNVIFTETSQQVSGCASWPETESENQTGTRDTSTVARYVLLPPGTVVTDVDALIIEGQRWEVDGNPEVAVSPLTGTQGGVEVRVKWITG